MERLDGEESDGEALNSKKMLKKLDIYIIRKFILTFFIAIILIIGIVIIFDISEKIDDFVSLHAPIKAVIMDYYLNFVPYFMNMFSPLFVFITVIFFTSMMASNSEIIAILSCGISYRRMMVPYMVSAALIAVISLALSLFVIPQSNATRVKFEAKYTKHHGVNINQNIHYQLSPGQFVYVQSFSTWDNTAYMFTLESIKDNKLVSKLSANTATWDSTSSAWKLNRYFERNFTNGLEDHVTRGEAKDTVIKLSVEDFYRNNKTVETLSYRNLNELIRTQRSRGDSNVMYALIEKHTRFALPFSAFILTIMGVSLSSRKRRGGIGWNIGIGIALSFSYILFLRFSQMFVYTGTMPPGVAIWLPNFIFAIVAGVLYKMAQK